MKTVKKFLIIMTVLVYLIKSHISYINNFDVDEFNKMFPAEPVFDLEKIVANNAEIARQSLKKSLQ